jgi:acyl dehydratase
MLDMLQRVIGGVHELRGLVGQELGASDWLEVSQELIDRFAELTGDRQWIHVDPRRAQAESPYGTTVAHGFLTLSLVSPLHSQVVRIGGEFTRSINYGFHRVRFPAAVPAGARIRVHSTLETLEEVAGGVQLTWAISVEIEGQTKPAVVAQWLVRLYR